MKKFLIKNVLCVLLSFSACSLKSDNTYSIPPILPEGFSVLDFIEGMISEVDGWKILNSDVVDKTTSTEINREFVEVVDELILIYKNENNRYFKMKVNYPVTHGEYLFWSSEATDSLESARNISAIDVGYFVVDEFLKEVEGKVSIDNRTIINGNILAENTVYSEYVKTVDKATAIYKSISAGRYSKFTLNTGETGFLFNISAYHLTVEDAENDYDTINWIEDFYISK